MSIFESKKGVKLYYEKIEAQGLASKKEKEKETVVFLNGVMTSVNSWYYQTNFLEKFGYEILLHDFKGQLRSDKPKEEYSIQLQAQETKELIDHLKLNKIHLVGTSYGGEVALQMAIYYPELIRSVTVIDSVSELDHLVKLWVDQWMKFAETKDHEKFYWGMLPLVYGNSYLKNNEEMLKERVHAFKKLPLDFFEGQIELYKSFLKIDITKELHKIVCPTMVICGENDLLKPVKFSKIISDQIKNSEFYILPDCGHVAIFEKVELVNTLILGFLMKNSLS